MNVPILRIGSTLLASVQVDLRDTVADAFQEDVLLAIERTGAVPRDRIAAARRAAQRQAASARRLDCVRLEVVVTSPGRQAANADELVEEGERFGAAVGWLRCLSLACRSDGRPPRGLTAGRP